MERNIPKLDNCRRSGKIAVCDKLIPKKDLDWFTVNGLIDSGRYGDVYVATTNTEKKIIVKIFVGSQREINNEICYQNIASEYGVAPKILDYWLCKDDPQSALIAMDFAGNENLFQYFSRLAMIKATSISDLAKLLQVFKALVLIIHHTYILNELAGIFHFDLHLKNIICTIKGDRLDSLMFIDFGQASNDKDMLEEIQKQICNDKKTIFERFDGIQKMFKQLYADRMMPFEFFKDDFVGRNLIFKLFYEILYLDEREDVLLLNRTYWRKLDQTETMEEFLQEKYEFWTDDLAEGLGEMYRNDLLAGMDQDEISEFIQESIGLP